ncbi:hypothetical protein K6U58_00255 [Vibrio fluvialis]|uniref:hypothetical protein n=1 Tax=Vibrio fluvialis TaxID=676 RepID=UPI001C9C72E1|nr:hypothetical protein [Vibrio fluvialis]MBY7960022.1 hypothetical protein [Vibrio fluvialis]MCG6357028.1 hypothetical protein [Vibrio fluvialis]
MGWIYLPSVSIQNGSNIVTVNNTATDSIKPGDGLLIGAYDLVEIIEVSIGQLKLKKNWSSSSQSNAEAAVVPTFGDFNAATAALRQATTITQGNFAEMEKWWTQLGQVTFKAYNNTEHTVRTAKQMDADVSELEAETRDLIGELAVVGYFPSESQFEVMREQNQSKFAASDFVYHGRSRNLYTAINQGLWSTDYNGTFNLANTIRIGDKESLPNPAPSQNSKSTIAIFNAAGVPLPIRMMNEVDLANLVFPPAPNGTVTYDSATGVVTDFTKDAGHYAGKVGYETVAERAAISGLSTLNEAVASAFEGEVKNGDFRLGNALWSNNTVVENGKLVCQTATTTSRTQSFVWDETAKYEVTVVCSEWTAGAVSIVKYGVGATDGNILGVNGVGTFSTVFDPTSVSGNNSSDNLLNIYNVGIVDLVIDSISIRKVTNQVVTDRVDMTGLEIFAEEVKNGEVFPVCIQNLNSNVIAGVPMRLSTRPKSYFQVYDGQYPDNAVNNAFYCWDWPALTTAQKAQVADYLKGAAFVNSAGNLVQWRVRNRSFAGAGNGDWNNISSNNQDTLQFAHPVARVKVQGVNDAIPASIGVHNNGVDNYYSAKNIYVQSSDFGVFSAVNESTKKPTLSAYNGECYFYVIATVPRLNQGAHHPELNPMGARRPRIEAVGTNFWHGLDSSVFSKKYCFMAQANGIVSIGFNNSTGNISSAISGRPDGKFYDAIYPSGQGGVIDHRLKYGAWDASSYEQAAVVREEVKNGIYRGRESLVHTEILDCRVYANSSSTRIYLEDPLLRKYVNTASDITSLVDIYLENSSGKWVKSSFVYAYSSDPRFYVSGENLPVKLTGDTVRIVFTHKNLLISERITVEGNFSFTDVIGDPANILQCSALKDGWLGAWVPVIPDGVSKEFPLTRKDVSGNPEGVQTIDSGSTWTVNSFVTFDPTKNSCQASWELGLVLICNYTAFAKQTENSYNLPVFNGEFGVANYVEACNQPDVKYGSLLIESLLGMIVKAQYYSTSRQRLSLTALSFDYLGKLSQDNSNLLVQKHSEIGLLGYENETGACKVLSHQINESGQASLNIVANELIYSSTASNWGDDSKVKVLADSTFTDLNGNKCRAVIHKLAKPYGFIQNKI